MKEEVSGKRKTKIFEKYLMLILIATLFMSVGYAQITDIELEITGTITAPVQTGVFISDISVASSTGLNSQEVIYYRKTALSTSVVLSSSSTSYVNYQISLYNNSGTDYYFTGVTYDSAAYDNANITYLIEGLEPNVTRICARETVKFTLTFKYADGVSVSSAQTLNSLLSFNFSDDFIDFKVDNQSYTVPNGITWEQFISSEYNTNSIKIENEKVCSSDGKVILSSGTAVLPADVITEGTTYEYETIEITITRASGSGVTQGGIVVYNMTYETNSSIKTTNIQAQILNSSNSVVSYATVSGSGKNFTITINTSSLSAGTYKIKIPAGALVTVNRI